VCPRADGRPRARATTPRRAEPWARRLTAVVDGGRLGLGLDGVGVVGSDLLWVERTDESSEKGGSKTLASLACSSSSRDARWWYLAEPPI
jgi:hypothetical protein